MCDEAFHDCGVFGDEGHSSFSFLFEQAVYVLAGKECFCSQTDWAQVVYLAQPRIFIQREFRHAQKLSGFWQGVRFWFLRYPSHGLKSTTCLYGM